MLKDKNNSGKKKSTMDKIIMGAIIGTAVGSAIGVTMAPKKGKETRESLVEHTKEARKLTKETAGGFWRLAKKILFQKKKKSKMTKGQKHDTSHMKEIPNEMEITPTEYVDRD